MKFITLRKMSDGQWRAINEPDTYVLGAGVHIIAKLETEYANLQMGWGTTPQEALDNLLIY